MYCQDEEIDRTCDQYQRMSRCASQRILSSIEDDLSPFTQGIGNKHLKSSGPHALSVHQLAAHPEWEWTSKQEKKPMEIFTCEIQDVYILSRYLQV